MIEARDVERLRKLVREQEGEGVIELRLLAGGGDGFFFHYSEGHRRGEVRRFAIGYAGDEISYCPAF